MKNKLTYQPPTENWKKKLAKMFKRATCYNEVEQFISNLLARREREVAENIVKKIEEWHLALYRDLDKSDSPSYQREVESQMRIVSVIQKSIEQKYLNSKT